MDATDIKTLIIITMALLPMLVGGFVARAKKDYFSRGVFISMLSSWFGPVFMYLSPASKAREGDADDEQRWPHNGPAASLCLVGALFLVWIISKVVS